MGVFPLPPWALLRPCHLGLEPGSSPTDLENWFRASLAAVGGASGPELRLYLANPGAWPTSVRAALANVNRLYGNLTGLIAGSRQRQELLFKLLSLPGYPRAAAHLFLRELWTHWPQARSPFGSPDAYETWFVAHAAAYQAELAAVRSLLPTGRGVEIGIGTGRFATPLGLRFGVEPAPAMATLARERGLRVIAGTAESLPLRSQGYDFALLITVLCFSTDPATALAEAHRILKPGGTLLLGLIDPETPLGRFYRQRQSQSDFYRFATFRRLPELVALARTAGFYRFRFAQTLWGELYPGAEPAAVQPGFGRGGFAVIAAVR